MPKTPTALGKVKSAARNLASALYSDDPDATLKVLRDIQSRFAVLYETAIVERQGKAGVVNAQVAKAVKATIRGANAGRAAAEVEDPCRSYERFIPSAA